MKQERGKKHGDTARHRAKKLKGKTGRKRGGEKTRKRRKWCIRQTTKPVAVAVSCRGGAAARER